MDGSAMQAAAFFPALYTAFSWGRSKLPISGAPLVWAPLAVVGL